VHEIARHSAREGGDVVAIDGKDHRGRGTTHDVTTQRIGPYEVLELVGRGGMATVYRCRGADGREVAVKVIRREYAEAPQYVERFKRECVAVAGLRHPNLTGLLDFGLHEGQPYAVMEYLPCPSLQHRLDLDERLAPEAVLDLLEALLEACSYYAAKGLVHRDIKPSNILLRDDGTPVIVDFGLVFDAQQSRMTRTGEVVGTPAYMPPEILRGMTQDIRGDLYQMGVVGYECLTGELPYDAPTPAAFVNEVMKGRIRPVRSLAPECPVGVATCVENLLVANQDLRYQTADEALGELRSVRGGVEIGARRAAPTEEENDETQEIVQAVVPPLERKRLDTRWVAGAVVLLVGLLAVVGVVRRPPAAAVSQPRVTAGWSRLRVEWVSRDDVRARIVVTDEGGATVATVDDGAECRLHTFVVTVPGGTTTGRVTLQVMPGGATAEAVPFQVQAVPTLALRRVAHDVRGLAVEVATVPPTQPVQVVVTARGDDGRQGDGTAEFVDGVHVARLPAVGPDVTALRAEVTLRDTDERRVVELDDAFRTWVDQHVATSRGLKLATVVTSLVAKAAAEAMAADTADLRALRPDGVVIDSELQRLPSDARRRLEAKLTDVTAFARRQPWGSLLLELGRCRSVLLSSPLVRRNEQRDLFELSLGIEALNAWFAARHWPGVEQTPRSFGPSWDASWRGAPPTEGWTEVRTWELVGRDQRFEALDLAYLVLRQKATTRRFEAAVDRSRTSRLVCWCFEVKELPPKVCLAAEVDGDLRCVAVAPPAGEGPWFCQVLPSWVVRGGTCGVDVKAELLPGLLQERKPVLVRRVVLLGDVVR